jgi:hypothetical protein
MTDQDSKFVSAHTVSNRFEADALLDALERDGIPTLLRSFVETPYNGLFVAQRGWGLIMVPEDRLLQAQQTIESVAGDIRKKRIYTDPEDVDPLLWETLRQQESGLICANAMIQFDQTKRAYRVPFLDLELLCLLDEERIEPTRPTTVHRFSFELALAVLHYLLESRLKPLSGQWVSEKDLPGGELFFRGPHAFPTNPLLALFGTDLSLFRAASERLGGTPVPMGDAAYRVWALPRVPILFILWGGDDEFEPVLHIRFDKSVTDQLESLGTLYALVNVVCRSLRATVNLIIEERGA